MRITRLMLLGGTLAGLGATPVAAQTTYEACYVPSVGAIYLIKLAGLPAACLAQSHVAFSWTEGGGVADGSVTEAKLAFNPATQAELDALAAALAAAGTINTSTNPVAWTKLKGVPAGFADGTDDGGVSDHGSLTGLADDDHPQYVLTNGLRSATNGFAVTGTIGTGSIPATGAGVRLMWYPGKAAFRAGEAVGSEWDDANIGSGSVAMGGRTTASGSSATAMGGSTVASGAGSTAVGQGSAASADFATAMGYYTTASGGSSTASGSQTTATGTASTAMGFRTTAQSFASLAIGQWNVISGSTTSWVTTDPLFVAGNGIDFSNRLNALTLLKNGNMTIAGTLTQSSDIRFKEAVEPLATALDGVLGLQPIRYRFREGTGHPTEPRIGLSAQEVERVFPELVARDAQGYLSVAYTDLAAVLVRAVQEQQQIIEALRTEVAALRAAVQEGAGKP
jgi:hypothetical protein